MFLAANVQNSGKEKCHDRESLVWLHSNCHNHSDWKDDQYDISDDVGDYNEP